MAIDLASNLEPILTQMCRVSYNNNNNNYETVPALTSS